MLSHKLRRLLYLFGVILVNGYFLFSGVPASEAATAIVDIRNIGDKNWEMASFSLDKKLDLHIHAQGAGTKWTDMMYAYAWILDARSRTTVWKMDLENRSKKKVQKDVIHDEDISLLSLW